MRIATPFWFLVVVLFSMLAVSLGATQPDCPPKFEIGQTYHEIQQGPCPDIDSVASMKPDSTHTVYLCKSQHIAVVGSVVTGKMEGFFLYRE